jgi:hypothetical protein
VLSLWDAKPAGVQPALDPMLKVCLAPVKVYAAFAGGVIAVIVWPFKQVWAGVMRKPEPPEAVPDSEAVPVPVPVVVTTATPESLPSRVAGDAEGA